VVLLRLPFSVYLQRCHPDEFRQCFSDGMRKDLLFILQPCVHTMELSEEYLYRSPLDKQKECRASNELSES
jgi:hypothetical protein